jgi:CheY-like chemotaxis protein
MFGVTAILFARASEWKRSARSSAAKLIRHHCGFAIFAPVGQASAMTQPLALFLYEKLLPGGQLINRLQDLGYRVHSLSDPADLVPTAEREKPLLVLTELEPRQQKVCDVIAQLKQNPATAHVPVIAFTSSPATATVHSAARNAGATLVVSDTAILAHLNLFLDQALQVD